MAKSRSGAGLVCLSLLLVADGCREQTAPASARAEEARLDGVGCEALVPAAFAATTLGHDVRYSESRQRAVRFQVVSCEHVTMKAEQVFAFDVGCGSGARERFVTVSRSLEKAVRQTEPKIGDEAWASPQRLRGMAREGRLLHDGAALVASPARQLAPRVLRAPPRPRAGHNRE